MSRDSRRTAGWGVTRARILTRDAHTCAYCGREANEVDHIIPIIAGGTDADDNLIAACKKCNGTKSGRLQARLPWFNPRWLDSL